MDPRNDSYNSGNTCGNQASPAGVADLTPLWVWSRKQDRCHCPSWYCPLPTWVMDIGCFFRKSQCLHHVRQQKSKQTPPPRVNRKMNSASLSLSLHKCIHMICMWILYVSDIRLELVLAFSLCRAKGPKRTRLEGHWALTTKSTTTVVYKAVTGIFVWTTVYFLRVDSWKWYY